MSTPNKGKGWTDTSCRVGYYNKVVERCQFREEYSCIGVSRGFTGLGRGTGREDPGVVKC